jgi:hypothetical protein
MAERVVPGRRADMSFHEGSGSSKCHTSVGKPPRNREEKVKKEGQMDFCCIFIGSGKFS